MPASGITTITEDTDLSYRAQLRGWNFIYDKPSPTNFPEINAFKAQQSCWTKGTEVAKKNSSHCLCLNYRFASRWPPTFHLQQISFSRLLFAVPSECAARDYQNVMPQYGWYFDLMVIFTFASISTFTFYTVAQYTIHREDWQNGFVSALHWRHWAWRSITLVRYWRQFQPTDKYHQSSKWRRLAILVTEGYKSKKLTSTVFTSLFFAA